MGYVVCVHDDKRTSHSECRTASFFLRRRDLSLLTSKGRGRNNCDWERSGTRSGNVGCEFIVIGNHWANRLGAYQIELSVRDLKARFVGL